MNERTTTNADSPMYKAFSQKRCQSLVLEHLGEERVGMETEWKARVVQKSPWSTVSRSEHCMPSIAKLKVSGFALTLEDLHRTPKPRQGHLRNQNQYGRAG